MAMNNEQRIEGNVGKIDYLTGKNGKPFVSMTVATNRRTRTKDADGNYITKTTWFDVLAFGKQAEIMQKREISKGDKLAIRGFMDMEKNETPDRTYHNWSVVVEEFDVRRRAQAKSEAAE